MEAFFHRFPEVKDLFLDGTERATQRSQDKEQQKKYYSGKKKGHTRKNLILNDEKKRVLLLSATESGSHHDYAMFKKAAFPEQLPPGIHLWLDLGFQGIQKDFPQLKVRIPHKKPKGRQLSEEQKLSNTSQATKRVIAEHTIGGIKRLNFVSQVFRNRKENWWCCKIHVLTFERLGQGVFFHMVYQKITCPSCSSEHVKKNGRTKNKKQNYFCHHCKRQFITNYSYNSCKPWIKQLIVPMTLNSSGIRDIARVLSITPKTVLTTIAKEAQSLAKPNCPVKQGSCLQLDEQWSFVQNKSHQQWLWSIWDASQRKVISYHVGPRTEATCRKLLQGVALEKAHRLYSDHWKTYSKLLPKETHRIGKTNTQSIERYHLNLRTHLKRLNRKTICFSKSKTMHQAVIKLYLHQLNSS